MNSGTQRQGAKLRTKTGCLTCRNRRKKCDEQTPVCSRCSLSGRQCQWPTSADLLDRRYASHRQSRHSNTGEYIDIESTSSSKTNISLLSEATAHRVLSGDLEFVISRHFIDQYYGLLLLPNCHPDFYHGWINEIQDLMVVHKSLHYSVLANAASHLHFIEDSSKMQELALTYYSKALKGLSQLLTRASHLENHNGILMSVMLLYLHGCMGRGTYLDIPRHLNAASRVLTLRLFHVPLSISRPFDRLAVESVLYQIFLVTTGLWSDEIPLDYDFDANFWLRAEQLLNQSIMFPGQSNSLNSPVLGVPVPLFRLAISLKQLYQSPLPHDPKAIDQLRSEVEVWEGIVLCEKEIDLLSTTEQPNHKHNYYKSASYLFILIISLLLDQVSETSPSPSPELEGTRAGPPRMAPSESWQVRKAIRIMKGYEDDDGWAGCFMGNWPVYTLGFFMNTIENVELTRTELERRWSLTKFTQLARFTADLENTWTRRGLISATSKETFVL